MTKPHTVLFYACDQVVLSLRVFGHSVFNPIQGEIRWAQPKTSVRYEAFDESFRSVSSLGLRTDPLAINSLKMRAFNYRENETSNKSEIPKQELAIC